MNIAHQFSSTNEFIFRFFLSFAFHTHLCVSECLFLKMVHKITEMKSGSNLIGSQIFE